MTLGILGKKLGMTQLFQDDGTCIPVTVVQAGPCKVLQVKMAAAAEHPGDAPATANLGKKRGKQSRPRRADGYYAVQLGFDDMPVKRASGPELGHAKAAGCETAKRFVREFRYDGPPPYQRGEEITISALNDVERVDVIGISKGRGWAGTIKRHNFGRQATTHGNSKNHRRAGGIGRQYSTHHGVPKGKKMAGHYGVERITVMNLQIVERDEDRNLLYIRGAIPGHRSSYVMVRKTIKT